MTQVYLIRHGEIDNPRKVFYGGTLDLPLIAKGKQQISNLGEFLQKQGILPSAIYTSHLSRAKESGQILAEKFGITEVIEDERLGDNKIPQFAGLTHEEKEAKFPGRDEFDKDLTGHESLEEVTERMYAAFSEIVNLHKDKVVFIVSHSDPLRLLMWQLSHLNENNTPDLNEFSELEKGCVWRLLINQQGKLQEYELIQPNEVGIRREQE